MSREQQVDVVFDGPPGPSSGRFVEVEDGDGKSVNVGEWIRLQNGWWALRMTVVIPDPCPNPKEPWR